MRINRFLSMAGVTSRRKADTLVEQGRVSVNGETITELGTAVDPATDEVRFDGNLVEIAPTRTYLILYKPIGYLTTLDDPFDRHTVKELLNDVDERVYPVGRLDLDVEGLLLCTNDGKLAHRLMHPKYKVPKTYRARVKGVPSENELERLRQGILLEDGETAPAEVHFCERIGDNSIIELKIHEGRKRQVKRMYEAIDHPIIHLKRTHFAFLDLGNLSPGQTRQLTRFEINRLRKLVGLNIG